MAGDVFQLDQIQKWMQSVISHPEGVAAGLKSAEAQQQIPILPDSIEEVVTRSQSLTSLERLQVYGNAYYARLVECLQGEFPAVARAVGTETFDVLAMGYLQSYPSRSYTLAQLGANFPRFLAEIPLPTLTNQTEDFAAFLIDLATLERLYSEVFDRAGRGRRTAVVAGGVAANSAGGVAERATSARAQFAVGEFPVSGARNTSRRSITRATPRCPLPARRTSPSTAGILLSADSPWIPCPLCCFRI